MYVQQPIPTVPQLQQRLNELQQAMLQVNDPNVQQQILQEVNYIQQMLGTQLQQQQGYQPLYQPPTQQQNYQPMPEHNFNNASNTFQPAYNDNNQPSFDAMTGGGTNTAGNSKYDKRVREYAVYDTPGAKQPAAGTVVENLSSGIPMIGSEYEPLLAIGLVAEKEILGNVYKYKITGDDRMSNTNIKLGIMNTDIDEVIVNMHIGSDVNKSDVGNFLEINLLNTPDNDILAVDVINSYGIVTNRGTSASQYFELIKDTTSLKHVVNRIAEGLDTYDLYSKLDKILASNLTHYIKHVGGLDAKLTSLTTAYEGYLEYLESLTDIEVKKRISSASEILHASLLASIDLDVAVKDSIISDTTITDEHYTVPVVDKETVIYTNLSMLMSVLNDIPMESTLAVTKASYSALFDVLQDIRTGGTVFGTTHKAILMTASHVFEVYHNTYTDYYTIVKK